MTKSLRQSFPSEYNAWCGMKSRCNNTKGKAYENYGGRGVRVCKRWLNSFENFLKDMGGKPSPDLTLERINNNSYYKPSNCKWATRKEQMNNRRHFRIKANERIIQRQEKRRNKKLPVRIIPK